MEKDLPLPPGWGDDKLTDFLTLAHQNRFATFVGMKEWFGRLTAIDACFSTVSDGWINPANQMAAHLFIGCHAAFRTACEVAVSGQVAQTYPQMRVCLEYAGYALHIHRNPDLGEVWISRHNSTQDLISARNEFTISKVKATIRTANRKAHEVFDELYQRTIDFGAHPNERALTGNMDIVEMGDRTRYDQLILQGDGLPLVHVMKTLAQTGICTLEILQEAFPARFELLGVRENILILRKGL